MRGFLTGLAVATALVFALPAYAFDEVHGVEAVEKAERDFAADTAKNGFHRGFIAWSTPDAIGFFPEAGNFHQRLVDQLAADPGAADKPTPLRWKPFFAGRPYKGELAFDLGTWTLEGSDKAGWFFTIWQLQSDGTWKWTLDGGAGSDTPDNLPRYEKHGLRYNMGDGETVVAPPEEGLAQDDAFNQLLRVKSYGEIYDNRLVPIDTIASDGVPPYMQGYVPWEETDGSPPPTAEQLAAREARLRNAIAARPKTGLTWTRDGNGTSRSGSFVYSWGHAKADDGTYLGHYVRVWHKVGSVWTLTIDLFQK